MDLSQGEHNMIETAEISNTIHVTNNGTLYNLPDLNAEFYIPPGAITMKSTSRKHNLKLHIIQHNIQVPGYVTASHMYEFLPHGLKTDDYVLFKFPLSTQNHLCKLNNLSILYRNDQQMWIPLPQGSQTKTPECLWAFYDGFCHLFIKEFFKIIVVISETGNNTKQQQVLSLRSLMYMDEDEKNHRIHITFCCTDNPCNKWIKHADEEFGQPLKIQPLLLYCSGGKVDVSVKVTPPTKWDTKLLKIQTLTTDVLYNMYKEKTDPGVTFYISLTKHITSPETVIEVTVQQQHVQHKQQQMLWKMTSYCRPEEIQKMSQKTSNKHGLMGKYYSKPIVPIKPLHLRCTQIKTSQSVKHTDIRQSDPFMQMTSSDNPFRPYETTNTLTPKQNSVDTLLNNSNHNVQNDNMDKTIYHGFSINPKTTSNNTVINGYCDGFCEPSICHIAEIEDTVLDPDLDPDFMFYLTPVIDLLNTDKTMLKTITASLAIFSPCDINAEMLISMWLIHNRKDYLGSKLRIWIEFLQVLKFHQHQTLVTEFTSALEKQLLKSNIDVFGKQLLGCESMCDKLLFHRNISLRQYKTLKEAVRENMKICLIIDIILAECNNCGIKLLKEFLQETKQLVLLDMITLSKQSS